MSDALPRVELESGEVLEPQAVVRSECGQWVSCIYEHRVERRPAREVAVIRERLDHDRE